MFKGKKILLGVTAGIAAYKTPDLVRAFKKSGADVFVVQTKNSRNFVSELVLETVSENPVGCEIFSGGMKHIDLADVDLVVVAPATANFLSRYAHGAADDLLMTTLLATQAPVVVCPAMNSNMWGHAFVQENVERLKAIGVKVLEPDSGELACGVIGKGRLPSFEKILQGSYAAMVREKDLMGKKVLITAGATREYADPVRFLSNGSSGKMGVAFAVEAAARGAEVCLVLGNSDVVLWDGIERIDVVSGKEMYEVVNARIGDVDVFVSAAAVCDYSFAGSSESKLKKNGVEKLVLSENVDVLKTVSELKKDHQVFVGFALESSFDEVELLKKKNSKKMDFLVANKMEAVGSDGEIEFEIFGKERINFLGKKTDLAKQVFDLIN